MKTTLFMAMSANGIIARENGDEDFLSDENWEKFCELAREFGNFIIGRKTYEAVKKWGEEYNFDDLAGIEKIVISQNSTFKLDPGYILADSPQAALKKLTQKGFEKTLVAGGSTINSAFAKEGLLDQIILNIEPVLIGQGIPLFAPLDFDLKTKLICIKQMPNGIITLQYQVVK